ncbi:LEAF RUST 10 DISEASE-RESISTANCEUS RECEPTOR-LIKE PROTEIN KINASE-like 2.5 isoform X2 [Aegilops tauschii subsp. strangulata]|uniref:LEAF RUST 10 DISEASE-RESISTANCEUS RECEPTOR-LIKE PROTEIN KINASE-like 2.5 isoform X2 n=1 Tax=Aegilops tauschii subsp. strangulata TaxID=200361 RepID=UPI001E1CAABA|nr:LEAF RUST 10 DISEASE-RESISTANCE LOCUS RECEPTOR-LIKE PROTEIN KINASE-like 2.5 isoform X2 [Aegilops tauschii subsp. strangulata]
MIMMIPLLWLLFASVLPLVPPAGAACSPKRCGDLNITYPFWLEDAGRPPCGSPSFQLNCNGSQALLSRSSFGAYQVVQVFPENSSFIAVDKNLPLDDGCPKFWFNISLGLGMSPFIISKKNRELLVLDNCSKQVTPLGFNRTRCTSESFYRLGEEYGSHRELAELPPACRLSIVPVLGFPDGDNYVPSMRQGFLLEWAVPSDNCAKCEASGGLCRYANDGTGFSCHCSGDVYPDKCGSKGTSKKIILIAVTSAAGALLFTCIYVLVWRKKGKRLRFLLCKKTSSNTEKNYEAMIVSYGSLAPKRYMYSEVMKITSSRNDQLGKGGYGIVFKGRLPGGRLVAVKFLHDCKGNGDEFVNEVMSIGRTSHVNVVSLYGFCLEGSKRALIYEYMPNGSLDKYIYSEHPKEILGWERLYGIAIGIARGLEYLHHSCNTRIVHFDIKPQNILLDKDFSPKIADFGLAKLCHTKESKVSMTGTRGTIGFIAPEVHSRTFGVVSTKSDVYSYGMMLLEMVGGRRNVKSIVAKSSEKYFPDWIYDHFAQDGLQACEVTSEIEEMARKMTLIGLWCVQILPAYRPTITKVLEMFERGSEDMDMPPKQNFSGLLESSAHNMNVQSLSSTRSEEIGLVNSEILQESPTL